MKQNIKPGTAAVIIVMALVILGLAYKVFYASLPPPPPIPMGAGVGSTAQPLSLPGGPAGGATPGDTGAAPGGLSLPGGPAGGGSGTMTAPGTGMTAPGPGGSMTLPGAPMPPAGGR